MSRSVGCVKLDGKLLWLAVNNSTDVGVSLLYHNRAMLEALWESNELGRACQCKHTKIPVQFFTEQCLSMKQEFKNAHFALVA